MAGKTVRHSLKTTETDAVRVLMIQRAISVQSLAVACGVTGRTMANQIAANFPSRRLRNVVESIFGVAIWTAPDDFERRKSLVERSGINPFVMDVPTIQRHATAFKIVGRHNRRRASLISSIEKHFAPPTTNQSRNP
jgi:hypothetical protein